MLNIKALNTLMFRVFICCTYMFKGVACYMFKKSVTAGRLETAHFRFTVNASLQETNFVQAL